MELTFTKRGGKYDDLVVRRDDRQDSLIQCPKQGIIPHDMVHFAVESTLAQGGFLSLVRGGQPAAFETKGGDGEESIERLVEVFQAELWGGRVPAAELIAAYEQACDARGHKAVPVSPEEVDAVRTRLDTLSREWAKLPVNGSLSLTF